MSPLAHPKGKTPSRSCNLRKGVLFSAHGQALLRTTSQSASQTAPLVGELSNGVRLRGCTKTGLPIAVRRLCHQRPSPLSLVASSSPRPGCGSQHPPRSACVLLAAAPTAPPCFRHWRRSSPLPQRGSPWHVGQLSSGRAKHNISETAVLRCLVQRQLDKERCPEAAVPVSKARPLAPYRASGVQWKVTRPAKASPFGRGVTEGDGEGKPGRKEPLRSDRQAFCQSDTIAVQELFVSGLALSVGLAPAKAGLRLPASASLPLASCWPRPQQLLPVSATGGGRRRCPKGGAIGMSVSFRLDERSTISRKR